MKLTRFERPDAFRERAEPFLLTREADNNLILGIISTLMRQPDYSQGPPYLAIVEHSDIVVAAAVMTPPHNLVLSHTASPEALVYLARDLAATHVPGVLGSKNTSVAFAARWQERTGHGYHLRVAERIYQLERVNPVLDVPGYMRRATADDYELLLPWVAAFQREAINEHNPMVSEVGTRRLVGTDPALRGCYLWEDGVPVALAGYGGPTPHGIRIGPVYTPPEHRRRGYASACVAALSQLLLDSGRRFCFLFTDLANPTSNHIYQTIGYQPVCDMDEYSFTEALSM